MNLIFPQKNVTITTPKSHNSTHCHNTPPSQKSLSQQPTISQLTFTQVSVTANHHVTICSTTHRDPTTPSQHTTISHFFTQVQLIFTRVHHQTPPKKHLPFEDSFAHKLRCRNLNLHFLRKSLANVSRSQLELAALGGSLE